MHSKAALNRLLLRVSKVKLVRAHCWPAVRSSMWGSCRQLRLHHHSLLQALPQALGAAGVRRDLEPCGHWAGRVAGSEPAQGCELRKSCCSSTECAALGGQKAVARVSGGGCDGPASVLHWPCQSLYNDEG